MCFSERNDKEIARCVTDNADTPTIFEYILAVVWYRVSGYRGRILDFMRLTLDADLLPVTHAAGGEADIVYEYEGGEAFPSHTLLLEATLADGTNQRRMEMEPVSRHLGNRLLANPGLTAYCIFVCNELHAQVVHDFRGRKGMFYSRDWEGDTPVRGMKIIPLQLSDIKAIVERNVSYEELYAHFEGAYLDMEYEDPREWYRERVRIESAHAC